MDKKLAGLLGAAAALTTMTTTQASPAQPTELTPAASYSDLLGSVPNALALQKADDARLAKIPANEETRLAQVTVQVGHHHHHHHRRARRHHHHHHHHHHN